MQIIRRNFVLKLLALAIAIVGWAYFRFATNPVISARFDQQLSVPIVAANLPDGYVAHFPEKEAVVTIATRRGAPPIKPDEIKAVLDLSNRTTGVYNIPLQLVAPTLVVQSLSPASVSLTIERIESRVLPLAVHYRGQRPSGVVVGSVTMQPATVVVHGATGALGQISTVRVDVPIPGAPGNFDEMVRPRAVDSFGQEIPGLDVAPDLVRVQIQFIPGTGTKGK